jgi:PAS domain S-box-containing protein
MKSSRMRPNKIPWQPVMVFSFFSLALLLAAMIYLGSVSRHTQLEKRNDLESIAALKVDQISNWLNERLGDGWALTLSPIFAEATNKLIKERDNQRLKNDIRQRLAAFNKYMDYSNIIMVDNRNKVIIEAAEENIQISPLTSSWLRKVRQERRVIFSDFYFCDLCRVVHIDIFAPVYSYWNGKAVLAVLILRINPDHFLYPAIQKWPIPSVTGETYLIQRQGNSAMFLNELRFKKNTALKFSIPINNGEDYPSTAAATGKEGFMEGTDYHHDQVMAYIKKVPDSDWALVAKMNKKEIFSEVYRQAWYIFIITGILILTAALTTRFLWVNQQKKFYQRQYELEKEKYLLNQRYQFLTKYANDVIMLCDEDRNIVDANEKAIEVYGYQPEELYRLNVKDIRAAGAVDSIVGDFNKADIEKGAFLQTVHKHRDGTIFPVEISLRPMEIEGKKYFQGIIRDISERKRFEQKLLETNERLECANEELQSAQEELQRQLEQVKASQNELKLSEKKYRSIFENTGTASVIIEDDTTISLANLEFEKLSGYSRSEIEGKIKWIEFVWKPDLERMKDYHHQRRQDHNAAPRRYEFRFLDRIGKIKDIFATVDMIPGTGKSVASLLDLTKRKAAEQQVKASLREKEILLREIYHRVKNNLQVVSSLLNLQAEYAYDPKDKEIFKESQNRIRSMSLVHENLYKSPDLSKIDFSNYVRNLVNDLIRSYGFLSDQLIVMIDISDISLGVDTAIPCGLMINEMVTNSLKHAFKAPPKGKRKWELAIKLQVTEDKGYRLEVSDNGAGFVQAEEPLSDPASMGLQLIKTLVSQLDGKINVEHKNGTRFVVEFGMAS